MLQSLRLRNTSEQETKFIQERITVAEKSLADLCNNFGQFSRKAARIRDKGDELARSINSIASSETTCKSLSDGLANFASSLTVIGDLGEARVQNIDQGMVTELAKYEGICKQARDQAKQMLLAKEKEASRRKQLERIKERNPRNGQQIVQAETELTRASAEVSRTIHDLEERIMAFERQKIHDIKGLFLDFIASEMGYHAKALEQFTLAFEEIDSIDEHADIEEFRKILYSENVAKPVRNSKSLGSINNLFSKGSKSGLSNKSASKLQKAKSIEVMEVDTESESSDSQDSSTDRSEATKESEDKPSPFIAKQFLH